MNPLIANPPATARQILDAFANFYRNVQIDEAGDTVMFEWGSQQPRLLSQFTDIRGGTGVKWDSSKLRWIGCSPTNQRG
jgi:hypothetical protein